MWASPYAFRAASTLCALQSTLQFSTVAGPPRPRGMTWSISVRTSDPQIAPDASFHWHRPSSRLRTSRFTFAGTEAVLFSCCARSSCKAAVSTCSSVAPGCTCDCPALAFFSSATNSGDTVMWIRLSLGVRGSTTVRRAPETGPTLSEWVSSGSTSWTAAGAAFSARYGISVTIVLLGTCSAGRIFTTTCFASCREQWKNLGSTSVRFSSVITLASSMRFVAQRRPSLTGSTTSGKRRTSRAPTCR
jgi:hypothetical protein